MPVFFFLFGGNPIGRFADVTSYTFLRSFSRHLHFRFVYDVFFYLCCAEKLMSGLSDVWALCLQLIVTVLTASCQNFSFLEISD